MRLNATSLLAAAGLYLALLSARGQTYSYSTLAGWPGSTGAIDQTNYAARFNNPYGLALDSSGNIFVADTYNCTIRKVTPSGSNWVVTTIAGLANSTTWVDGTNTTARFNLPYNLALDSTGNLYVTDYGNHVIRKIRPSGTNWITTTLAGSAQSPAAHVDGTNQNARFGAPYGITVDQSGTLYITEEGYNTVRKVAPVGTNWVVTTLAGSPGNFGSADGTNSVARFSSPAGLTVDSGTNLYVTDAGNSTIRKVRPVGTNWVVTTLAGLAMNGGSANGTNAVARFNTPGGIALAPGTNLFVADTGNSTIRKVVPSGTNWVTSTIGGMVSNFAWKDGTNSSAWFSFPTGVATDGDGLLYIADRGNSVIRLGVPLLTNAPSLSFSRTTNTLTLSWPITGYYFLLETRASAATQTSWNSVNSSPYIAGTRYYWTTNLGLLPAYYRLHKQ